MGILRSDVSLDGGTVRTLTLDRLANTGTVQVGQAGRLIMSRSDEAIVSGNLVGGTWIVDGGSVGAQLSIGTSAITTNSGTVILRGSAANFSNLVFPSRLAGNVDRTIAWLKEPRTKPFFVFFHTYEIHSPYRTREEFVKKVRPWFSEAGDHALDPFLEILHRHFRSSRTELIVIATAKSNAVKKTIWLISMISL